MLFYILTIAIGMIIIAVVNILINGLLFDLSLLFIILAVVINTVAVIAVDGLFAFIIRRLPKKWFHKDRKFFQVSKRERNFYNAIKIKSWKDKVLELGQFTSFTKKKVVNPNDNEYVERFILECNYGYVIHLACIFVGFLIIFFYPLKYWFMFGLPVAIVNAFLNLLPTFILRYNVPRLQTLYLSNERKQKRKEAASSPLNIEATDAADTVSNIENGNAANAISNLDSGVADSTEAQNSNS